MKAIDGVGYTLLFIACGAVAGVLVALLSMAPVWAGLTSENTQGFWDPFFVFIVLIAAALFGAVLMPALGWLLVRRVGILRAVVGPFAGALAGALLFAAIRRSLNADPLVLGALLGAVVATAGLRWAARGKAPAPATGTRPHTSGTEP